MNESYIFCIKRNLTGQPLVVAIERETKRVHATGEIGFSPIGNLEVANTDHAASFCNVDEEITRWDQTK